MMENLIGPGDMVQFEPDPLSALNVADIPTLAEKFNFDNILGPDLELNDALPGLTRGEPTALLVDYNNIYRCAKHCGFNIDTVKLYEVVASRCDLRYATLFSAIDAEAPGAAAWEQRNKRAGWTIKSKTLKRYTVGDKVITKGNMDVEMTLAATKLSEGFRHVILATCDGDFEELIKDLSESQLRTVSVMTLPVGSNKTIQRDLMRSAKNVYDLSKIHEHISY